MESILEKIKVFIAREQDNLSGLTGKKKLAHLWEYYRYWALLAVGIIIMLIFGIQGFIYNSKNATISGLFLNVGTSMEGYDYLSYDYQEYLGGNARADLIEMLTVEYTQGESSGGGTSTVTNIDALISAQSLDYMIIDQSALTYFGPLEMCADLETVLSAKQLALLREKLVACYGLDIRKDYCAAIDITDSAFAAKFGLTNDPAYLVILVNAPAEPEAITDFLNYFFQFTE
ncbi:MAG: hypothetical protein ACI4PO_02680 [Faecousia sp.]